MDTYKKVTYDNLIPSQIPLFRAQQANRYDRQAFICFYEEKFCCRLIVIIDVIGPWGVTYLEDLIYDASPEQDMHVLLFSPGGVIQDPTIADAVLDRLVHNAYRILLQGESMRKGNPPASPV